MDSKKKRTLVAASVAGLLAVTGVVALASNAFAAEGDKVACYGANKCKGTGECGGKGHSCAGQNACKGEGVLKTTSAECLAMEGGRLTEEPKA